MRKHDQWLLLAVRYRELAEQLKLLAEGTRDRSLRTTREIMAQDYEFLALIAERRHNGMQPLLVKEKA